MLLGPAAGLCAPLTREDVPLHWLSLSWWPEAVLLMLIGTAAFVLSIVLPKFVPWMHLLSVVILLPVAEEVLFRFVLIECSNKFIELNSLLPRYELLLLVLVAVIVGVAGMLLRLVPGSLLKGLVVVLAGVVVILVEAFIRPHLARSGGAYYYPGAQTAVFLWSTSRFALGHVFLALPTGKPSLITTSPQWLPPAGVRAFQVGDGLFIGSLTGLIYIMIRFEMGQPEVGPLVAMIMGCWLVHILFNGCMVVFNWVVNTAFQSWSLILHVGARLMLLLFGAILFIYCYLYGVGPTIQEIWLS